MTWGRRAAEIVGITLIGDAVVVLLWPGRHLRLWKAGPRPYRVITEAASRRPWLMRAVAAAELVAGLWLVERALAPVPRPPRRR